MGSSPKISYLPGHEREKPVKNKKRVFKPGKKLPAIIAVFLLFYLLMSFFTHFNRLYVLQNDIKDIEQQLGELKLKNEDLRKQIKQVQSDAYVEQMAREKLGLVKPGESRIIPVPETGIKNN
ncbi:MAG: FtsB family cell division protein [Desulfocucumaceae bacterium]